MEEAVEDRHSDKYARPLVVNLQFVVEVFGGVGLYLKNIHANSGKYSD